MASSLILTGGLSVAKTLKESIVLPAHGFAVGDVLRWNNGTPSYVRAVADSAVNAEVLGIVSANTDVNTFELTYSGYVDLPQYAGLSYPVLFLSGVCAGGLTHNPPSAVGTVIKPVVSRHPTSQGFVMHNYLGTQIGGSSTIAVDEIQPVGTIMPFAGTMVPETWLRCDGASYGIGSYAELYSNLLYSSGDRTPIYGYVATLTGTNLNNFSAGDVLQFKNNTNAWSGGLYDSNAEMIGVILSVTSTTAVVQTLPVYNSSNKTLSVPSVAFKAGSGTSTLTGSSQYRVLTSAGAIRGSTPVATVTGIAITHFNTPDLRGRFALGVNQTTLAELEDDATNISAISSVYPLGSEGGEERHTLTTGEMPAHNHTATTSSDGAHTHTADGVILNQSARNIDGADAASLRHLGTTVTTSEAGAHTHTITVANTGSNTAHNNMPPYVALQYIIKAKPYTRAAIIDGVDLPYSNLLIRSTDSNSLRSELLSGFSGGDLVFYTNSGEASKTGTERMRLTAGGTLSHGGINNPLYKNYSVSIFGTGVTYASNPPYPDQLPTNLSGLNGIILSGGKSNTSSTGLVYESAGGGGAGLVFSRDYGYGTYISLVTNSEPSSANTGRIIERMRIDSSGNVGIGTTGPTATLDVNGTLKVGNFGGATNVMAKPNMIAGSVGLVVPLVASAGDVNSDGVYYVTSALSEGTWLVFLQGFENAGSTNDADPVWVMFKVWTVPAGNYLVFSPNNDTLSATGNSGMSYRMNTSSMQTYLTTNSNTVKSAPWVKLNAPIDVTIAGNYNPTGTQTGIVWNGRSRALLASGYAIRIA